MDIKLRLQKLIYSEGITLDVKNRALRTKKMNMLFGLTADKQGGWEAENENSHVFFTWESLLVAGDGLAKADPMRMAGTQQNLIARRLVFFIFHLRLSSELAA